MKTFNLQRGALKDIAQKCGVTHSAVSQWFSGITKPSLKNMLILRDEFGVPFDAWLDIKSFLQEDNNNKKQAIKRSQKQNLGATNGRQI